MQRLRHAFFVRALTNRRAESIVHAISNHRPPIVHTGADDVHLITTLWAVFMRPQFTGPGIHRRTLHVAIAEREHLGTRTCAADEGIVRRYATVFVQANN